MEKLLVWSFIALSSALACKENELPVWPTAYHVKGQITIPYAELVEPFEAWYDANQGRSRIDYYGGTDKSFQFSKYPTNHGANIQIIPVTTELDYNKLTCVQSNGTTDSPVKPQQIIPDMTNFTCEGYGYINGIKAQKWIFNEQNEEKLSKYVMWIQWKINEKTNKNEPIPIYYEMKGYDILLISHYDHYYFTYEEYTSETPLDTLWDPPMNMSCTDSPGSGQRHMAVFNPMKEFIHNYDGHVQHAWKDFLDTHNKEYRINTEHALRKHIFKQNYRMILSHNRANLGYKLKINHLADRTKDELKFLRGKKYTPGSNGGAPFPYSEKQLHMKSANLPESFDWRLYGAVTPVKDQSICGSCWSFAVTGTVEGTYFLKTGNLISLSEQSLMDCSWGYGNGGCDGGNDFQSYQWMMKHGGLPLEDEYGRYLAQAGYCHSNEVNLVAPITGWVNVTSRNEKALQLALFENGPISVSIDAGPSTFDFYSHGVYYEPKCSSNEADLDHSVLLVGYGIMNGKNYWLVKNSWSNLWGNDGYILMDTKNNNCGVMTSPTYVTM